MDSSQWLDKILEFAQTDWGIYSGLILLFILVGYLAMKK
jgi:hypothetical protein